MAASALPSTLKSVTLTKIAELKKQRTSFEDSKKLIKTGVKRHNDELEATDALVSGTCRQEGVQIIKDELSEDEYRTSRAAKASKLNNAQRLLRQAKSDPVFPTAAVEHIFTDLTKDLDLQSLQHQHAQFFSELVTEWVSNPDDGAEITTEGTSDVDSSSFETLQRKQAIEQREEWERLVFTASETDGDVINAYLEKLFKSNKTTTQAYDNLKTAISGHCHSIRNDEELFDVSSLKISIKGLLATDLLNEDKRAILKTFSSNKEVMKEVSDVLNMRFKSLDSWQWTLDNGAITVQQRLQLNGKYRVFMDEDVLDALLVYAIGMRWATAFRGVFMTFYNSFAWHRTSNTVPLRDRERREWFLGSDAPHGRSVQSVRRDAYTENYFMTQLPETVEEGARGYNDDDSDDEIQVTSRRLGPLETKHSLLHLLITEAQLARHLRPQRSYSVIRSDFKWFGPSLSHTTIFTVMRFFGVDDFWLKFFRKFLETPVRFAQDGPNGQIQTRARGVPMSHCLSDTLSESVMFTMDYAVNKATRGNLYRLHDDFWFWGFTPTCETAWSNMRVWTDCMGVEFNEEKTGSVVFETTSSDSGSEMDVTPTASANLPEGKVTWGFLTLDPSTMRFEIDQDKVDEHIVELQRQLSTRYSIFSYVQAWNSYFGRFFSNNFGKPSFAFGRSHIDQMISTLARIQKAIFPSGRVTDHLHSLAKERFSITSLPDGFYYWPVSMGGLEVRNPLVQLYAMRDNLRRTPERILEKALEADEVAYTSARLRYERENTGFGIGGKSNAELRAKMKDTDEFMSREEYMRYREERSPYLAAAYDKLLSVPEEQPMEETNEITALLETLPNKRGGTKSKTIMKPWSSMDSYWKWIVAVYGRDVKDQFGSLQMVDAAQVPLGVVSVMKQGKVKWSG